MMLGPLESLGCHPDDDLARAVTAGCLFALDSDAHSTGELPRYATTAIAYARLAGVPTDRIVNCWSLGRLLKWAPSRRSTTAR